MHKQMNAEGDSGVREGERFDPFHDPYPVLPEKLITSQHGPVALLRISRAGKRNALDPEMIAGIETFFRYPPEGTRAIVLHGDGGHFCAGADLSAIADTSVAAGMHLSRAWHRSFEQVAPGGGPVGAVLPRAALRRRLDLAAQAHR